MPPAEGIANTFSVTDDQGDHASTTVTTPVVQDPKASVLLVSSDKTSVDHAGEVINFTVIEANTGNVTLDTTTTEKLNGVWTALSTDTLLPSQAKLLHYSYTVTQADMDAGLSIGTMVEIRSPQAVFGDNSWKGVQVGLDQKATVNVENLESFDNGQNMVLPSDAGFRDPRQHPGSVQECHWQHAECGRLHHGAERRGRHTGVPCSAGH